MLIKAGLPSDLIQIVNGYGHILAPAIIEHTDHISFTGSVPVGKQIAVQSAERMKSLSLELGGKGGMIVLDDAHINHAAKVAVESSFVNAGQVCINSERIFVHESIYDAFKAKFLEETKKIRQGISQDYSLDYGALIQ